MGGWRIVQTMGSKITKLQPVGGFAAETAGASHSSSRRTSASRFHHAHHHRRHHRRRRHRRLAVRWGVAGQIVWAWVLTIPASATIGALVYWLTSVTLAP